MSEGFHYAIDGDTLRLSPVGDEKSAVSIRKNSHLGQTWVTWPWGRDDDITKVVIEDRIHPSTCRNMFSGLENLTEIEGLENLDMSKVTDMSCMFKGCRLLVSLDLSSLDTSRIEDMSDVFAFCRNLKSLNLSGWDTSKATSMFGMFNEGASLTSIEGLSGWDTSHVTDMSCMFRNCKSLESLDLSNWDTPSLMLMTSAFLGCASLASLDLSGWNTGHVTSFCGTFEGDASLTSIEGLENLDLSSATRTSLMFHNCPISHDGLGTTPSVASQTDPSASEALAADEGHTGHTDPDPR